MKGFAHRVRRLEKVSASDRTPVLVIDSRDGIEYWLGTDRPITDAERERAEVAIRLKVVGHDGSY